MRALLEAIEIWRDRAAGVDRIEVCPLCKCYPACRGCPINEHTGGNGCEGTPYDDWGYDNERIEVAQREYEFLLSLLPKIDLDTHRALHAAIDGVLYTPARSKHKNLGNGVVVGAFHDGTWVMYKGNKELRSGRYEIF